MAIKKMVKKTFDSKKEANIRGLISDIEAQGVQVRREELKRGLGFRVMSGRCRAFDKSMIFLDRRLSQDEQIDFLKNQVVTLQVVNVQVVNVQGVNVQGVTVEEGREKVS